MLWAANCIATLIHVQCMCVKEIIHSLVQGLGISIADCAGRCEVRVKKGISFHVVLRIVNYVC